MCRVLPRANSHQHTGANACGYCRVDDDTRDASSYNTRAQRGNRDDAGVAWR